MSKERRLILLDKKKKCPPEFQHGSLSLGSSNCNTHWQGGKSSMRCFTFVIRLDEQRKPQRLSLHSLIKLGKSFIFLGSKITADDDCSLEIKRCLLLGRKAMTHPDSILKSRDIALPTKVCPVKAMILPVVWMWELDHKEGWVPKNWCFGTVVLEKALEILLNCKESNQSILKEISLNIHWKDWCWGWNSNTLATWWEELTH